MAKCKTAGAQSSSIRQYPDPIKKGDPEAIFRAKHTLLEIAIEYRRRHKQWWRTWPDGQINEAIESLIELLEENMKQCEELRKKHEGWRDGKR